MIVVSNKSVVSVKTVNSCEKQGVGYVIKMKKLSVNINKFYRSFYASADVTGIMTLITVKK